MNLREAETGDGTRFASNSPPAGGEQIARGARSPSLKSPSRWRILLSVWGFIALFLGGAFLGGMTQAVANPPAIYTPPAPQAVGSTVTVQPGVTLSLPTAHVNITFVSGLSATNVSEPGYGKSLLIGCYNVTQPFSGCYNITVGKTPATYPGIWMNFTTWNPTQTTLGGAVIVASVVVPSGTTTLYLNLSGLTSNVFVFPLVDGASQGGVVTNSAGSASFSFWDWSKLSRTIEVDVGKLCCGPAPRPPILPPFTVSRSFDFFNASSDEWVGFRDMSTFSGSRVWKFGDGSTSAVLSPMHHYNYSVSGSFNVTLLACSGSVCNVTSQSVVLIRWHLLVWGAGITLLGGITIVAVWNSGRISKRIGRGVNAQVTKAAKSLARGAKVQVKKVKRRL